MKQRLIQQQMDAFLADRVGKCARVRPLNLSITRWTHDQRIRYDPGACALPLRSLSDLEPDQLAWLSTRARPFHCNPGHELLSADRMPEYCYAIVEGRGRCFTTTLVCADPSPWPTPSPGDLVGWAGLACRQPCEWITAITSLRLIGIKAEDFQELGAQFRSLSRLAGPCHLPGRVDGCLGTGLATETDGRAT